MVQAKQTLELLLPEGDYAAALDVMDDLRVSPARLLRAFIL